MEALKLGDIDSEGFLLVGPSGPQRSNFTGKIKICSGVRTGSKMWYKNGKLHREDGPAVVWAGGSKHWYKNGNRHREDGPAVDNADGSIVWYYDGIAGLENFPPEAKKKVARKFIHEA